MNDMEVAKAFDGIVQLVTRGLQRGLFQSLAEAARSLHDLGAVEAYLKKHLDLSTPDAQPTAAQPKE